MIYKINSRRKSLRIGMMSRMCEKIIYHTKVALVTGCYAKRITIKLDSPTHWGGNARNVSGIRCVHKNEWCVMGAVTNFTIWRHALGRLRYGKYVSSGLCSHTFFACIDYNIVFILIHYGNHISGVRHRVR